MVDVNVLIKVTRKLGILDWPTQVNYMRLHLEEMLKGFPGIGLGHLTLIEYKDLLEDDIYIYDPSILSENTETPMMIKEGVIIGIGCGSNTGKLPGDKFNKDISPTLLVLRVDCRPKDTGGAGYYYFYKSKKNYQDVE